jgi:hypothetical protein
MPFAPVLWRKRHKRLRILPHILGMIAEDRDAARIATQRQLVASSRNIPGDVLAGVSCGPRIGRGGLGGNLVLAGASTGNLDKVTGSRLEAEKAFDPMYDQDCIRRGRIRRYPSVKSVLRRQFHDHAYKFKFIEAAYLERKFCHSD